MKIARDLSVSERNGATSCVASQSSDGTDSRGNFAAWASGPEKSRQRRHDVIGVGDVADWVIDCTLGLLARILERSGRDARGIEGGAPLVSGFRSEVTCFSLVEPSSSILLVVEGGVGFDVIGGMCIGGSFLSPSAGDSF